MVRKWFARRELLERKTIFVAAATIQTSWRRMKQQSAYTGLLVAAISIQAMYKGVIARKKIRTRHAAARVIQMKWLSHSWGLLQRDSATKIQSIWRSYVKRGAFKATVQAAVLMQKNWRRAGARYLFQKSIFAVTILQCAWRKYSAQLNYQLDLLEIVLVQSVVRRRQAMKEASNRKRAVHAIQMATRTSQANHRLKELKYQKIERETHLRSVLICQVSVKRIHLFFFALSLL
jgi:myosin heavy subunit